MMPEKMRSTGSVCQQAPPVRLLRWSRRRLGRVFLDDPGDDPERPVRKRLLQLQGFVGRRRLIRVRLWIGCRATGHLEICERPKKAPARGSGAEVREETPEGFSGIILIWFRRPPRTIKFCFRVTFLAIARTPRPSWLRIAARTAVSSLAVGVRALRHKMIPMALIKCNLVVPGGTPSRFTSRISNAL
jgi:hypothetical protein